MHSVLLLQSARCISERRVQLPWIRLRLAPLHALMNPQGQSQSPTEPSGGPPCVVAA
jgi:hypothetical protein